MLDPPATPVFGSLSVIGSVVPAVGYTDEAIRTTREEARHGVRRRVAGEPGCADNRGTSISKEGPVGREEKRQRERIVKQLARRLRRDPTEDEIEKALAELGQARRKSERRDLRR